jgi:SAM-dependent methyltransferase
MQKEDRTIEQLERHYVIEKALADKLKKASLEERRYLYSVLYSELFNKVPDHPQLTRKVNESMRSKHVSSQIKKLIPLLSEKMTFLELGAGDCSLSYEVSKYVKKVIAVDVSADIAKSDLLPSNFELIISDGSSVNVQPNTVDIAYSNQLMEHLHPDDALMQLKNIYKTLVSGGIYICITPHRFLGPHDISEHFDKVATGFHLKEYTYSELYKMFKSAGFYRIYPVFSFKGRHFKLPLWPHVILEKMLYVLLMFVSRNMKRSLSQMRLFGIEIIAIKR